MRCSLLQSVAVSCNVLQCVARAVECTCFWALQHTATHCNVLQQMWNALVFWPFAAKKQVRFTSDMMPVSKRSNFDSVLQCVVVFCSLFHLEYDGEVCFC